MIYKLLTTNQETAAARKVSLFIARGGEKVSLAADISAHLPLKRPAIKKALLMTFRKKRLAAQFGSRKKITAFADN